MTKPVHKKTLLADTFLLLADTDTYQHYGMEEVRRYLVYPIQTGNIIPFYKEDVLVGFFTWSWLSDKKSEQFLNYEYDLDLSDYRQREGDKLWGIDFVAPYGNAREIFRKVFKMKKETFGGVKTHWRRFSNPKRLHKL